MKEDSTGHFYEGLYDRKRHSPLRGLIELTYRCNLRCLHCYCLGFQAKDLESELDTSQWKRILDEVADEGCIGLTISGGEPLLRDDFLDIYSYAKKRGFLITLFSNGQAFTREIIDYLVKSPPFSIEITLNGITRDTYEAVTQIEGSFYRAIEIIKTLSQVKLPLILKTNCLKTNRHEIAKIKSWAENLLGRPSKDRYRFKYDPMIYPRLNGDKEPTRYRLSFGELVELKEQDIDIWTEYQKGLHSDFPELARDGNFLYQCTSFANQFFINPYGRLKFCEFSDKFSVNLQTASFREGFYEVFPQILNERFRTDSKCKDCSLRPVCYYCPARAYLETGDEEAPVEYFCELAKATSDRMRAVQSA